jgi:signal transduction histidine kinase
MLNTNTIVVGQELLVLRSELDEFRGAWRALCKSKTPEALRDKTEKTLSYANQILEEGRRRVQDLRTHDGSEDDLANSFTKLQEELQHEFGRNFRLLIEDKPKKLHRVVQDEVKMIAKEALSNAFQHAQASDVLCAVNSAKSHFVLLCKDDGVGIDPRFLTSSGKPGHWGLIGMREGAGKIGVTLRSQRGAKGGTGDRVQARRATGLRGKGQTTVKLSAPGPELRVIALFLRLRNRLV